MMNKKPAARHRHWSRFASVLIIVLLVPAVIYGSYYYELARVGAGYFAKTLCSASFVGKLPPKRVTAEDVRADLDELLQYYDWSIDERAGTVTASIFGFISETAIYREGLGCTLPLDKAPAELSAQIPSLLGNSRKLPATLWPEGLVVNLSAKENGFDRAKMDDAVAEAFNEPDKTKLRRTRAIVIVHKGRIVAERYAPGIGPNTPLIGWSMTKTVTSALTGILVREGKLSLDQNNLLPEWGKKTDERAEITVEDLLKMSSGLSFNEGYDDGLSDVRLMLFRNGNTGAFAADKPLTAAPGSKWHYSSGTTNILTKVLKHAHGGSTKDFLAFPRKALFDPLHMSTAVFEPDASGNLVGSSNMYASARDWARIGLLYLQNGMWNGERLLPEGWVAYSRKPAKTADDYGAHLWLKLGEKHMGKKPLDPPLPADAYYMVGHDGQIVAIMPSHDLVIVRLGVSRQKGAWRHGPFLSSILAAFTQ